LKPESKARDDVIGKGIDESAINKEEKSAKPESKVISEAGSRKGPFMTEVNTREHASFTVRMAMGVLTITFFAATVTAESVPPKPHYLGADPDLSASSISGVRLSAINPGSPAEKAGLQVGDIIVKLGTVAIKNPEDFIVALKSTTPNRPAEVIYLRQGKESRTKVSLEPRR